jgi:hypothetical protein
VLKLTLLKVYANIIGNKSKILNMPAPNPTSFPADHFEFRADPAVGFEIVDPGYRGIIDTARPLEDTGDYKVSAEINLGGDDPFLIIDVRESPGSSSFIFPFPDEEHGVFVRDDVEFIIISSEFNPISSDAGDSRGYKAIRRGRPVALGREHAKDRFSYSKTVSRDHAEILLDELGNLTIRDLNSANGTDVRAERFTQVPEHDYRVNQSGAGITDKARDAQRREARRIRNEKGDLLFGWDASSRAAKAGPDRGTTGVYEDPDTAAAEALRQEEQARLEWQATMRHRQQEINELEEPIRGILQKRDDEGVLEVQIPPKLSIEDAAGVMSEILDMRGAGKTDHEIYKAFAKQLHPDLQQGPPDEIKEEKFKLVGDAYIGDDKTFKF